MNMTLILTKETYFIFVSALEDLLYFNSKFSVKSILKKSSNHINVTLSCNCYVLAAELSSFNLLHLLMLF